MHDREYRVSCRTCAYTDTASSVVNADNLAGQHQFNHPDHTVTYRRVDTPRRGESA